jgi:hypothetical protein
VTKKAEELVAGGMAYAAIPKALGIKRDTLQVMVTRAYANRVNSIDSTPLTGLSGRALTRLTLKGIHSAEDLIRLTKAELYLIPGLGEQSLLEIEQFLRDKGLSFATECAGAGETGLPEDPADRDAAIFARYTALKTDLIPDKVISHQIGITLDQLTSALQQYRRRQMAAAELSHTTLDGLSDKVRRALSAEAINSFDDLTRKTDKDLRNIPNLGTKSNRCSQSVGSIWPNRWKILSLD